MGRSRRRVLEAFLEPTEPHATTVWQPPADIYQGRGGWLIKLDLAGVQPEEVHVRIQGRRMKIWGIRRDWTIREGHRAYALEIAYNRFERVIELPRELDSAYLDREYRNGMFLIYLTLPNEPTESS